MNKSRLDPLRKLARSIKYQSIYNTVKEIPSIKLFENTRNLSKIQLDFLYWLAVYNRLYCDLAMNDNKYLTKKIIENDFACECYLIWERKKKNKQETEDNGANNKKIDRNSSVPSVVFTKSRK